MPNSDEGIKLGLGKKVAIGIALALFALLAIRYPQKEPVVEYVRADGTPASPDEIQQWKALQEKRRRLDEIEAKALAEVGAAETPSAGGSPQPDAEETVANAYKLCQLMDSTGLTAKGCSVSGWSSAVDVSIDMTSSEARALCSKIAGYLPDKGITFASGWKLRISSPYSNGPIATCRLG